MSKRVVIMGDSITDSGRPRDSFYDMGNGYAYMVRGTMDLDYPGKFEILNRGIGGNRIIDIYARIKEDFINLKPDYASIYVGVNDALHKYSHSNGIEADKFETLYGMYLDDILEACPDIKIMLIAPFVLEGNGTTSRGEYTDLYPILRRDVEERARRVKKIAQKYGFPLIELQPLFDEACKKAPARYWSIDGIHPTPAGHELIKRVWVETFLKMI